MKHCMLLKHGISVMGTSTGICCYNRQHPSKYTTTEIDPLHCNTCIQQELNNGHSYRQGVNSKYGIDYPHNALIVLDLAPNKSCNLSCKICNEDSSSSWAKLRGIPINKNYNMSVAKLHEQLRNRDLSFVREINFSGGEPWSTNNIIKYVQPLAERIDFSQVELRFSTNGTYRFNKKLDEFFQQFKLVLARFSLDDIGAGHEYQRWPAQWDTWHSNWQYFLDNLPHNVMPSINRTVSVLNVHRLSELEHWHQQYLHSRWQDPIELVDHFAAGPLSLDFMPAKLRELAMAQGGTSQRYVINRPAAAQGQVQQLQQYIIKQDNFHSTDLEIYDPELYQAIFK